MRSKQLKMGVVLSYASIAIGALITLFTNPIINNLMGKTELGISSVIIAVTDSLTLLQLGMGTAYIRFYARSLANKDRKSMARINGMFLKIYAFISLIAIILGVYLALNVQSFFKDPLTPEQLKRAKIAFLILTFNTAIYFPSTVFESNIAVNERFIFAKVVFILKQFINPLVMIPLIAFGIGSVGTAVATTFASLLCVGLNVWFCVKFLRFEVSFSKMDMDLFKEILFFTGFVFITVLVEKINWILDPILLGKFAPVEQVSVYNNADKLAQYFNTLAVTVSAVFAPTIHRMVAQKSTNKEITGLFIKVGRLSFVILSLVLTGFIFFGKSFIHYWVGAELRDYSNLIYYSVIILFVSKITPATQSLGIQVQQAKNMHKVPALIYLLTCIINIVATIPLTIKFGVIGAGLGTLISIIIGNAIILNIYYYYAIRLNTKRFWFNMLKLIPAMVPAILFGIIVNLVFPIKDFVFLLFGGVAYICIYFIGMIKIGFNKSEKQMVFNFSEKIFRKLLKI